MAKDESRLNKRLFTINERILLHLKESGSSDYALELPAPMTQKGIADALGMRLNHVSRAAKALQKQGCVREATARVKGEIRRMKVYLITEEGMSVANTILAKVADAFVPVRDSRQRLREMPASEARRLLLPPRTYTALLASLDDRGILDIYKPKARRARTAALTKFVGAPPEDAFYGRVDELKRLRAWLQVRKPPVMAVTGERGVGKTALALQAVRAIQGKRPLFWFTFAPDGTAGHLVESVSAFLRELGKADFAAWTGEGHVERDELRRRLETALLDVGALIVMDGVPPEPGDVAEAARIVGGAASATGNQVLLTAREILQWNRDLRRRGLLDELELAGLDQESCRMLAPDLHDREFAKVYRLARGNPLEIKLLAEHADDITTREELTPEERALLRYLKIAGEERLR